MLNQQQIIKLLSAEVDSKVRPYIKNELTKIEQEFKKMATYINKLEERIEKLELKIK